MSQHDLSIANQGFPAFRADLNDALQALGSLSAGTSAPATVYAYQLWADTTTGLLKIRNAANSAWVTIGTLASTGLGLVDPTTVTTFTAAQTFNSGTLKLAGSTSGAATLNPPAVASTYTYTLPASTGTIPVLSFAQTWSAAQTFNSSTLKLAGSTSGAATLNAPAVASTYVYTLPAVTGTLASLALAQTYTAAQRGSITALTDGATITPDFALANNFSLTIAGNRTLANPTNLTAGQSGLIVITQDATGSRTLAYGSYWKFSNGTAPTLTTTASAVDVLVYYVESSTRITAKLVTDVK